MKNNIKEILLIGASHGDEPIGVEIIQKIKEKYNNFNWLIGNEKAYKIGKRGYTADLNRSAPGDYKSAIYESRRAAKILKISSNYKYIVDIHGTGKETGIFSLITNPKVQNLKLAGLLEIDNIVIWPAFSHELEGSLCEYYNCGLEIECGNKNSNETKRELQEILEKFLCSYQEKEKLELRKLLKKKKIFLVYDSYKKDNYIMETKLNEFKKICINNECFYPLLIGSYENVICYKMKKINYRQALLLKK